MGINFKSTFSASKRISEINTRNKQNLNDAISTTKKDILADLAKGKGVEGPLNAKEYSDKKYFDKNGKRINFFTKKGKVRPLETYKEYKIKKTGNSLVTMRDKGHMLQSMQVTIEEIANKLTGKIYFSADQVAKVRANQKLRYFFGLSVSSYQKLKKKLNIK